MTKAELINQLADQAEVSKKQAEAVLRVLTDTIHNTLTAGDEFILTDIGRFSVVQKAARQGKNPATGEPIQIPARRAPKFSAAKRLKDAVAK